MENNALVIRLIEQTAEVTHAKIDGLSDRIISLEKDSRDSYEEHKQHEKIAYETRHILDNHLRSDDIYQKNINENLRNISQILEINTKSLQEHMKRTDILEQLHRDNQARIVLLEEPIKFNARLKKGLVWTVGLLAGLAGIIKVIVELY